MIDNFRVVKERERNKGIIGETQMDLWEKFGMSEGIAELWQEQPLLFWEHCILKSNGRLKME